MKTETVMNDTANLNYIENCELASCTHSLAEHTEAMSARLQSGDQPVVPVEPEGAVVGGSVIAFTEGVSRQNKEDVMDSFLFATLVANKAFNPESQTQLWYSKYNEVLAKLGWFSTNWSYAQYRTTKQSFTMDQVGLEIIGSAIAAAALPGPASAAMLKVAADAIAALKAKDKPLKLFERQSKTHKGGSFRIAACTESSDGFVNVALGAVNFNSTINATNVLFWEWNNSDVSTYQGKNSLVLNSTIYKGVRELVRERLGNNAKDAIAEFEI
ncbi:hypothetical protein YA0002_15255 [Pseudomonas cichorii]|uniref:hypothetical protein n=1 Tax=Pseudomonas cichorii TaxID=36746 RepID=UPI0018E5B4CE|nr:hypothetical protein [Pseudomonas cichorii]MBI6854133.1 hypothetical protein [Pseudomonas cichorii]